MLTLTPLNNKILDDTVTFKLTSEQTSVEILPNDMVDLLHGEEITICVIRGYGDDHVRCLIYKVEELVYDQQYCFPHGCEVIGENYMDLAAYRLAEFFYASFLAENIQ